MIKNIFAFLLFWAIVSVTIYGFQALTTKDKINLLKVLFKGFMTAIIAANVLIFIVILF